MSLTSMLRILTALSALLLLVGACGGDEDHESPASHPADDDQGVDDDNDDDAPDDDDTSPDVFDHEIFSYTFPDRLSNIATGDFNEMSFVYGEIPVDPKYNLVLDFEMSAFAPPWREAFPSHGPLVLYNDDMEVLVFSPLDHFFVGLIEFVDGKIRYGLEGDLQEVPAGFTHRFILVHGQGIAATLEYWGQILRDDRGIARRDRYADTGLSNLGYWTDNGAAYYYNTIEGLNYEDTLLAIKAEADEREIPYGYFQIDSWWYFRGPDTPFMRGGLVRWEPRPDVFPDGLTAFHQRLGLPLIAHNKWFVIDNDYRNDYEFVQGEEWATSTGRELYDHFMADANEWGIVTYEPDWFMDHYWNIPYLRQGVFHAEDWIKAQNDAASDAGLTMQLCMPGAAHIMATVDLPAVTTVRTSIDYHASVSKESYWPMFHAVNMLAWAVGVWPFKDNFQSAERCGEQEALIANLSGGMVGASDFVGKAKREILLRTCRADGLLLKPDRPALPFDAMFLDHHRPYLVSTFSERAEGRWTYLAGFHIAKDHPQRTLLDKLFVLFTWFRDLSRMFPWPSQVNDWHVDLGKDLGLSGSWVLYNWRTGQARIVEHQFEMPAFPNLYDYGYFVLAPVFENGLALLGETDKYVTVADKRILSIETSDNAVSVCLAGAPGETIALAAFDTATGLILKKNVTLPATGETTVSLQRQ